MRHTNFGVGKAPLFWELFGRGILFLYHCHKLLRTQIFTDNLNTEKNAGKYIF